MHRRRVLQASLLLLPAVAILSTVATSANAASDTEIDGRGGRFDDGLLSLLEGRWALERQIRGTVSHNTLDVNWVLAHQFLRLHMKDVATPSHYEAIVLIGYVHASHEYVAHWTDTFGGRFSAIGRGIRKGDSVEFRFDYPEGPFYNTFTRDSSTDTWRMRLENQEDDGSRSLFALDTLRRAG